MTLSMQQQQQQQQQQQLLQQQQRQQRQQISSAAASASNATMSASAYTTANANAPYKSQNPLAPSPITASNASNIPVSHPKSSPYQPPSSQPLSSAGSRHSVSFADEVTGVPFPGIRFRNPQALQQLMSQNPSMSRHSYSPYATSALSAADSRVGPSRQAAVQALYEYRQGAATPTPMSNSAGGAPTLAYISTGPSATDPRVVPMQWHPQQYTVQRHPVIRPGLTAPQKQITIRGGIAYETSVGLPFGRQQQPTAQQQQQIWAAASPYVDTIVPQASQLNRTALLQQQVRFCRFFPP